ncbi:efflux RND transporter permease subunit [Rubrivirga marina]|uniref:Acriflavin resistance protein n=1 Tax=Rubrivirga marina TaxID=1196024 RepID=A0A271J239_9BACT|nr:efflux RND transporter permease subunit [Rubrivirga marina]PAP77114.1 acriflavin resistance protein [Rubrivirga marina]
MFVSDLAIRRPLVTVVAVLALVAFGLVALLRLETDEFPEINPPFFVVGVAYPGASPDGVEREVLDPIEEAVRGISGVERIQGTAFDSYAQLSVEFSFGTDRQEASTEIRDALSAIRADLPAEMEEPVVRRFSPNDFPIVSVALTNPALSSTELTRLADRDLARAVRGVPGVARVDVAGAQDRELTVALDPNALAGLGVSAGQVVGALRSQNLAAPVGRLQTGGGEQAIRLEGRLRDPQDFARLPIGAGADGRTVVLGQVAAVSDGAEEARSLALYDGQPAVGVDVIKASDASTTTVAADVLAAVEAVRPQLPAGTEVAVVQNAGERVSDSVRNVVETLLEGLALTVLVVFVFLNSWRSTVITGLALPVSMLASFTAVYAAGFTLNTMSLLGLTLAIGIIVDDAIVVRENIVRHVEMGKSHLQAAREGTAEIGMAVAATTFAIVAVFVPIAFIGGLAGQWFQPFALTIACSVLVSLFVSFSLDPMLSAYWPDPHRPAHERGWVTRRLDAFNAWFDRQAEGYRHVVAWALDHPKSVLAITGASFVAAFALPALGLVGGGFFPEDDNSEARIAVTLPPGTSLATTRARLGQIDAIAHTLPEVAYTYATVSAESGAVDEGTVYVRLVPIADRERGQTDVADALRQRVVAEVPGVEVSLATGFDAAKQIQLRLSGADAGVLAEAAEGLLATVKATPGTTDVGLSTRGRRPEVDVQIDRDAALERGVDVATLAASLRPAFAGVDAGDWVDPDGETRDVVVRYAEAYRAESGDLAALPVRVAGPDGARAITLDEVATVRDGLGPALVEHLAGEAVVTVEANVAPGASLNGVLAEIARQTEARPLPDGVTLSTGGEAEDQAEVFGTLLTALGSGILLMYLILVLQFGSFLDPLAILASLPLSLVGVMGGLWVAGSTINIMSMIGVILLAGIVAKNAILLIDFAKDAKARGMPTREALIEAGAVRLRPILMTTVALVAGMVPIAIGHGEGALFRRPLGAAVIGGVITSTLLTLLVIPTVYEILDGWRARAGRVLGRRGASPESPVEPESEAAPVAEGDGVARGAGADAPALL